MATDNEMIDLLLKNAESEIDIVVKKELGKVARWYAYFHHQ